jgi:hypothetical protein
VTGSVVLRVPSFLLKYAQQKAEKIMSEREPDFYIGGHLDPYMIRWWVLPRNKYFNIYMHRIVKSDRDEALHDHPWVNLSLLVRGAYDEHTPSGVERLNAGELRMRRATAQHRLAKVPGEDEIVTFFFTGPVLRHWGFACPQGWRHWKDFVGFRDETQNIVGRGCGEMDGPALKGGRIPFFKPLMASSGARPGASEE